MQHKFHKPVVLVPIVLLLFGFSLHFAFGFIPVQTLKFPVNFIIGLELIIMIPVLFFLFKNNIFIRYLYSGHAAISAISLFTVLVAVMAIFPQNVDAHHGLHRFLGTNHLLYTWYFNLSVLYLLLSLGMITVKRMVKFKFSDLGFYANHLGLWIIIASGFLGQADKVEYSMQIPEGETVWYAQDKQGNLIELDLAIELLNFNIEYYQPKIAAYNAEGEIIASEIHEISQNSTILIEKTKISIIKLINHAWPSGDSILQVIGVPGTINAAKIQFNGETHWISNESSMFPPVFCELPDEKTLKLLSKEPKQYSSEIKLYTKSGHSGESHRIEVNKPLKFDAMAIYQSSYYLDTKHSQPVSVLSIVEDPWLPVVYSGIFLLLLGAVCIMFSKMKSTKA